MVPVSPARTTGSLPRMEVMSNTYTTSFPRQVVSRRCASNCTWLSIILASILDQLLWYIDFIITYYCILLQILGFQLHFVAEGDMDALDVLLAINLYCYCKEAFNLSYQTFLGLRTNSSTQGSPCLVCVSGLAGLWHSIDSLKFVFMRISRR